MKQQEFVQAVEPVVDYFERYNINYFIGGSIASSAWGVSRTTLDVDIVADIRQLHIHGFYESLKTFYYLSEEAIKQAIQTQSSFNLIHLETMIKIDIFVLKDTLFDRNTLQRKKTRSFAEQATRAFYFSSPEDIILNKLTWYKQAGEISEKQWNDILGILKVQAEALDQEYLENWANQLELSELLNRALRDTHEP